MKIDFSKLTAEELNDFLAAARTESENRAEKLRQEQKAREEAEKKAKAERIIKARKNVVSAFNAYEKALGHPALKEKDCKDIENLLKLYEMEMFDFRFFM